MNVATLCNAGLLVAENGARFTMKTWICPAHVVSNVAVPRLDFANNFRRIT